MSASRIRRLAGLRRVAVVCAVAVVSGRGLAAQAPDSATAVPRVGCFRGEPQPTCASFWLIELQGSTTLLAPTYRVHDLDFSFELDEGGAVYELSLGHMVNLGPEWAVGGTVSLGTGAADAFTGVRARVRRWLSPDLSLEFEGGLARGRADHGWFASSTGISTGLRINIQDYGSAFVRWDTYGSGDPAPIFGPARVSGPDRPHFLRAGIGLGSKAAVVGTGLVAVTFGVLYAFIGLSGGFT